MGGIAEVFYNKLNPLCARVLKISSRSSQITDMSIPELPKGLEPVNQEQEHVHDVYNEIAGHFSQTRYKPWPIVEKFLLGQNDYSIGIDIGCGNGKYLEVNKKLLMFGADRSDGLIQCAKDISDNRYNVAVADGLNLPYPDNKFDFAISIAVIHHFASEERRIEAISSILQALRQGGELLIYCWALEQESSRRGYKAGDEQDIFVPWVLQRKKAKKVKKPKKRQNRDLKQGYQNESIIEVEAPEELLASEIAEQEPQQTKYRYYHLYKKGELFDNVKRAGGCTLLDEGYEKDNWWVIVRKD